MVEKSRSSLAVLGRIVAEDDGDGRQRGTALAVGQIAGKKIAAEQVEGRIGIVGVDQSCSQLYEVTHLEGSATSEKGRLIGANNGFAGRSRDRIADARSQNGGMVLVRGKIELYPVKSGFGECHGGERGADAIAHSD